MRQAAGYWRIRRPCTGDATTPHNNHIAPRDYYNDSKYILQEEDFRILRGGQKISSGVGFCRA